MSAWLLEFLTLESVGVGPDVSSVVRGLYARVGGVGPDVSVVLDVLTLESEVLVQMSAWLLEVFTLESAGVDPDVSLVVRGHYALVGRCWSKCQRGC